MNIHTLKWFTKFFTSLVERNDKLKEIQKMKKTMPWQKYRPIVDKEIKDWLNPMVNMAGVNFVVSGQEKIPKGGKVIYTPNHAGAFDIPAIVLTAPDSPIFMAKKELGQVPFLKNWMDAVDSVFVDRKNKTSAHSSLENAIKAVRDGRSLVIFPEGTRSKDGKLGEFRGGAMKVAMETGATVVPVLIEGTRACLEETGNVTAGTVYVTYLDPIVTTGLTKDDFFKMPAQIRAILLNERNRQRAIQKQESRAEVIE
jgi:1-acyl-sn-glycerol-3-phosphate acyltransferase